MIAHAVKKRKQRPDAIPGFPVRREILFRKSPKKLGSKCRIDKPGIPL